MKIPLPSGGVTAQILGVPILEVLFEGNSLRTRYSRVGSHCVCRLQAGCSAAAERGREAGDRASNKGGVAAWVHHRHCLASR